MSIDSYELKVPYIANEIKKERFTHRQRFPVVKLISKIEMGGILKEQQRRKHNYKVICTASILLVAIGLFLLL